MIAPELSRRAANALLALGDFENRDEFVLEVQRAEEWNELKPWAWDLIEQGEAILKESP